MATPIDIEGVTTYSTPNKARYEALFTSSIDENGALIRGLVVTYFPIYVNANVCSEPFSAPARLVISDLEADDTPDPSALLTALDAYMVALNEATHTV